MSAAEHQRALQEGAVLRGSFWIGGTDVQNAGTLEWSYEGGAILRLVGDTTGWPTELGSYEHTVHGILEGTEEITLLHAGVRSLTIRRRATMLSSYTLVWGSHTTTGARWDRGVYETANLAGWVGDTGLNRHRAESGLTDGVVMRPPDRRTLRLPRATTSSLVTEHSSDPFGYESHWSVRVQQRLVVDVRQRAGRGRRRSCTLRAGGGPAMPKMQGTQRRTVPHHIGPRGLPSAHGSAAARSARADLWRTGLAGARAAGRHYRRRLVHRPRRSRWPHRQDRPEPDGGRAGVGRDARRRMTPEATERPPNLGDRVGSSGGDELHSVSLAR